MRSVERGGILLVKFDYLSARPVVSGSVRAAAPGLARLIARCLWVRLKLALSARFRKRAQSFFEYAVSLLLLGSWPVFYHPDNFVFPGGRRIFYRLFR